MTLKAKGEGAVCAEKIHPSSLEIVNGDQLVATLTDRQKAQTLTVERGLGMLRLNISSTCERN